MTDKLRESINILWDRSCYKCGSYNCDMSCEAALAEPAIKESLTVAEPVAWMSDRDVGFYKEEFGTYPCIPLYTAPPRREWVGLTDEDMADTYISASVDVMMRSARFARAIEAKLKEKNT